MKSFHNKSHISNVVDIGPNISPATNYFVGIGAWDEHTFRADWTNVFYKLVIHDIWITPRFAVTNVGGTNIQHTVTGTNIPQGVTWSLIPSGVSSGAVIQSTGDWHNASVTPGDIATNYKVRATSVDNTNFYDQVDLTVWKIDIVETNIYIAVSNTVSLHLTPDSSQDAQWVVIPSVQNGASIQGSSVGTSVVINSGSIPTNYTVKAYAPDFTNYYDTCSVTVVKEEFKEYASCSGFDPTINPPWIMVPKDSNNLAKAETLPSAAASQIGFESADTNIALVSPAQASSSPETITVSGITNGSTEILAKLIQSSNECATLGVDVKRRIDKTIAIHAITEENDDVQVIPVGQGASNQLCIAAGTNNVLDSTPGGDDEIVGSSIWTGTNGICETEAVGDDIQIIDIDHGEPNAVCVTKGANNFRDTNTNGDDMVSGDSIGTGADGICDTTANNQNLVPTNVPSVSELQDYLNNTTWGKQANVYFSVTSSNATVNYDINRDGILTNASQGLSSEEDLISSAAQDLLKDINIYYYHDGSQDNASTADTECFIQDDHENMPVHITAHEVGHALGRQGESSYILDVMYSNSVPSNPTRVIKVDWNAVNPFNP